MEAPKGLPATSRIHAQHENVDLPLWCQVLVQQDSGMFCLDVATGGGSQQIVFFASALHGCPWMITLRQHRKQIFSFEIPHFRPAHEIIKSLGARVADDAWSLHRLDVKLVGMNWPDQSHLHFEIKEVSKPLEITPRTRAQTQQEDTIDELCSVVSSDA